MGHFPFLGHKVSKLQTSSSLCQMSCHSSWLRGATSGIKRSLKKKTLLYGCWEGGNDFIFKEMVCMLLEERQGWWWKFGAKNVPAVLCKLLNCFFRLDFLSPVFSLLLVEFQEKKPRSFFEMGNGEWAKLIEKNGLFKVSVWKCVLQLLMYCRLDTSAYFAK